MRSIFILSLLIFFYQQVESQERNNAFALTGVKWQRSNIEVNWENPTAENEQERLWVQEAITQSWQQHSNITFTQWGKTTETSLGIRIKIMDESDGPHTLGLGNQLDGVKDGMVLNFSFNNWSPAMKNRRKEYIKAIAVHEFGHALGLAHEHNRSDCSFCDKEKQGTDGDFYVTTCDPNSVMNYCNPKYNNWGKLSEGDKEAIATLYTKAMQNQSPTVENNKLQVAHTARDLSNTEKKEWPGLNKFLKVYIKGSQQELELIKSVTYHLHPSFPEPVLTVNGMQYNFGLGLFAWGQFELTAVINYKNGQTKTIKHFLDFEESKPNRGNGSFTKPAVVPNLSNQGVEVNGEVFEGAQITQSFQPIVSNIQPSIHPEIYQEVIFDKPDSQSNQNYRRITLSLMAQESQLDNIQKVVYTLPSSADKPELIALDRSSHFSASFTADQKFTVKVKIFYKDETSFEIEHVLTE